MKCSSVVCGMFLLGTIGCGNNTKPNPFQPLPECKGPTVVPFSGDRQLVVSQLGIANPGEGLDLNGDGIIDNKLGALASLANDQIATSFAKVHDIVIPVELFGYTGQSSSNCTKVAFYIGQVNQDRDKDGSTTTWQNGDCMDTDASIHPGATEVLGNRVDDNCDGKTDDPTDPDATKDLDGDGYSLAMGDCDDRADAAHMALAASRHPGAKDLCGDGIDQDCNGIADDDPSCDPFKQNDVTVDVQAASFLDPTAMPLVSQIAFKEGTIMNGLFQGGPDLFNVTVPIRGTMLNLALFGARIQMQLTDDGMKTNATNGMMGGVLQDWTLAMISGTSINAGSVIKPDQSLLDALYVGGLASILNLDTDANGHYLPDIDVDGDGLETFYNTNGPLPSGSLVVDTCQDGDGTIVMSTPDTPCALAKDAKGNYRFVDGLSAALVFQAVPAQLNPMLVP